MTGHLHSPAVLSRRKSTPYPLYRSVGGHQSRSGRYGEDRYFLPLSRIEPRQSNLWPVGILTLLSRLLSVIAVVYGILLLLILALVLVGSRGNVDG
jgi:hypothetical protein